LQEGFGVGDRLVDMRFRGQMCDPRELILLKQPPHQRGIPDIALDEHDASAAIKGSRLRMLAAQVKASTTISQSAGARRAKRAPGSGR
jgi:hypothetical protein